MRTQRLRKAHERRREHTKRLEGRLRKFRGQVLSEGDHVRVRLANFQSGVRQQIKMGNRKQIVIRFSPEIYVVKGVIDRRVNKLSFCYSGHNKVFSHFYVHSIILGG